MPSRTILRLALLLLALAPAAAAQEAAKQTLNDQLYEAARRGDAAEVKALLDKGADVNAKFRYGATVLFKAAERGHAEVVSLLLERGADPAVRDTFYNTTALDWVLNKGNVEVVRVFLAKTPDAAGDVLMAGVRGNNAEMVKAALERGGAAAETLTAALAAANANPERAALGDLLKQAGAKPPLAVEPAVLQSYVGNYKGDPGPEIAVTLKDGTLFAAPTGQPPIALMATDQTNFRPTEFDGVSVTFNLEGGKVTGIALKQGANTTQLKRVEK